jgi:hypothetical protein
MEVLPQDVWLERCARRIIEVEHGIEPDEARRLAREIRNFERTGVMPPEAAVEFVATEMRQPEHERLERRSKPR